jgi:GxxExxY protein
MDDSIARAPFPDPETGAIIGAGIAVHRLMGRGFLEPVYRAALAIEFARRQIPFEREVHLPVSYDGIPLPCSYRVDFICYESVLVEVKALSAITPRERSQILNYLRASNLHRGLLLNFGTATLQTQRLVWGLEDDPWQKRETTGENTERYDGPGDSARS